MIRRKTSSVFNTDLQITAIGNANDDHTGSKRLCIEEREGGSELREFMMIKKEYTKKYLTSRKRAIKCER